MEEPERARRLRLLALAIVVVGVLLAVLLPGQVFVGGHAPVRPADWPRIAIASVAGSIGVMLVLSSFRSEGD